MECTFYNIGKKRDSTLQPEQGTTVQVQLKAPCSITEPIITITTATAPVFTYAYIPSFHRYYFIREWTYRNAIWEASLTVDVLASFKTLIRGLTCYIDRSASNYDGSIIDTLYPAKT